MRPLVVLVLALGLFLSPLANAQTLDLNAASASELTKLPGIGKAKAQAIVDYREANGPFASVDDLRAVKGIGKAALEKLKPHLVVNGQASAPVVDADPKSAVQRSPGVRIDLNTATFADLVRLEGIGKGKAQAIIDYREANGGFKSVDELGKVKGIGKRTLEKLRPELTVSASKE